MKAPVRGVRRVHVVHEVLVRQVHQVRTVLVRTVRCRGVGVRGVRGVRTVREGARVRKGARGAPGARGARKVRPGSALARTRRMGARHHSELIAWQLSSMLRDDLLETIASPMVSRHVKFCEQISDAASSVPRNIAEGFGRYTHREFAHFLAIAIGSLAELQTLLDEAHAREFLDDARFSRLHSLSVRAWKATVRLKNSLGRRPPPKPRAVAPADRPLKK